MVERLAGEIEKLVSSGEYDKNIGDMFLKKVAKGGLTRDEDPYSHFCVYFAAFDPIAHEVFIGHHKKSGLWLFNGGHIDKNETPTEALDREMGEEWGIKIDLNVIGKPKLLTTTTINNSKYSAKRLCTLHFDIWYFVPVSKNKFHPEKDKLDEEFYTTDWMYTQRAKTVITDPSTLIAISQFEKLFGQAL